MSSDWLVYGANGYTGELVARLAVERGLRPRLAGRRREAVERLAGELGLEHAVFPLDDADALDRGLEGVQAVLHCAGPFAHTASPMAEACLRRRVHYLDITGEIEVFERLHAADGRAREAGVMLLPGAGFDVVPSDCLAAHVASRAPGATALTLAFRSSGGLSRGTASTAVENLGRPGCVRRGGRLTPVPPGWRRRSFDFGRGPRPAVTIPWGDVSTAWYTTGIPDVEVYMAAPPRAILAMRLSRFLGPVLRRGFVRRALLRRVRSGAPGPDAAAPARGRAVVLAEARGPESRAAARLSTPEGYSLTSATALLLIQRVLEGRARPGFQTPAGAYGADLVLEVDGVEREDLPGPGLGDGAV